MLLKIIYLLECKKIRPQTIFDSDRETLRKTGMVVLHDTWYSNIIPSNLGIVGRDCKAANIQQA